jgi:pimeloyl-ACP methyl ester carboxylesterase
MAGSRTRSIVVTFERCGHAIMAEQPDAALDALFAFAGE